MAKQALTPQETERAARLLCEGVHKSWDDETEESRAGFRTLVNNLWDALDLKEKTPATLAVFMAWVGDDDEFSLLEDVHDDAER